jgi:uncharacterized protein
MSDSHIYDPIKPFDPHGPHADFSFSRLPLGEDRQRVAIIGTGIAGLSAAWMLKDRYELTVFEKTAKPGGHSHSFNAGTEDAPLWIDMGFIVFNNPCYPNLLNLFDHLGVAHEPSDMSFGVSVDQDGPRHLEYASTSLNGLFAQRRNLIRPRFLSLLSDIMRFYKHAPIDTKALTSDSYTLGEYLTDKRYCRAFIDDHLLPQAAAIWSTSAREIMDYPLKAFIAFFENHGLLRLKDRVPWRTVTNGSQAYVEKLTAGLKDRIVTNTAIRTVIRHEREVIVIDEYDRAHRFDHVIFATHTPDTLAMLGDPDDMETDILGGISYTPNTVVLHTDANLMPKRRHAWSSWNYIGKGADHDRQLCVSYWMNRLQNLKTDTDYFVTLNPITPVDPAKIISVAEFDHPLFNARALKSQQHIGLIQGVRRTWFCGAWMGHGFHEDGLQSGLAVAEALSGLKRPWAFDPAQSRIAWRPKPADYAADVAAE